MPGPLVCEGPDLQRLLEEVHAQPGAEILYQDRVRRGGMFGFFAREVHRIAYRVADQGAALDVVTDDDLAGNDLATVDTLGAIDSFAVDTLAAPLDTDPVAERVAGTFGAGPAAVLYADPTVGQPQAGELPELAELLASAEAAETAGQHRAPEVPGAPGSRPAAGHPAAGRHHFADLLRTLTEADPDDDPVRVAAGSTPPASDEPAPAVWPARPAPRPKQAVKSNVTAIGTPDARARLELLMQLRQVGVPVTVNPSADTHTLYEALENILEELPAPAVPPRGAGEVLAIVGESGPALQAARTCAEMLRIPIDGIGVAGLAGSAGSDYPVISGRAEALRLRTELRRADLPSIVVIATDPTVAGPDDPWATEMIAALCPTAVWAVVDARWKTEDSRAQLDRLGRVDALAVHSAQLSASPASVWDLDLPLGLLDGRAASTFAWTGLLFPLLRSGARHRASA